jgi:flagellin
MFDSNFPKGPRSMANSVLTNSSALMALQNLNRTNERLTDTQSRINTGLKVQGAKDNAAVWAVAQGQRADMKSLEAVTNSLNRAVSIADVALAAGESISDLLTEMRQKAVAAADPSASEATRTAYNDEFQALLRSVASFAANASFDGKNLLNGSEASPLAFLANVNADPAQTISLDPQDFTPETLDLDGLSIGGPNPTAAAATLALVETALETVTAGLAEIGAQTKQIETHLTFISKLSDSLETGIGNLVDADMAKESARLQALQVQQQLGAQALGIANQAPQIILSLFRN